MAKIPVNTEKAGADTAPAQTVEKVTKVTFPPNKSTGLAKPSLTHFIFDKMQAASVRNKAKPFPIHLLG